MSGLLSDRIEDYCFIDTETKALPHVAGTVDEDVTLVGAYRYAECARVIMIQYAIGLERPKVIAFPDFDPTRQFLWSAMPLDLQQHCIRAANGKAWFAGWNMAFDRLMLNTIVGCLITPEMTIDVAAQGAASNLPAKLQGASLAIGRGGKQGDGKDLIRVFSNGTWTEEWRKDKRGRRYLYAATPQSHPEEWDRFKSYGARDIDETRAVFRATRQLPRREWEEYWANERINDRGMMIDADFAERCAAIAVASDRRNNAMLARLTGGAILTATQRDRIADWLFSHAPTAEARSLLVKTWVADDEVTGEDRELVPGKLSVAEDKLAAYINYFENLDAREGLTDAEADLLEIAECRRTGASATPAKFQKALDYATRDDRLKGQFRFNGAAQTGRFSSTGVQVHNLVRASLTDKEHPDRELDVIEFISELEL